MKRTGFVLLLAIGMVAATPASAQDFVMSPDGAVIGSTVAVAPSDIPWEARWTSEAEAPDADAAAAAQGGPPTPIIPTVYSAGSGQRPTLR